MPPALRDVVQRFHVSAAQMGEIRTELISEMMRGLEGDPDGSILMLPSYVTKRNIEGKSGVFYAIDLGGTNLRVLRLVLSNSRVSGLKQRAFRIPMRHVRGNAAGLFGFIADSVKAFVSEAETAPLGFTFSFPINKKSLNQGLLVRWTKSFTTRGVVGNDVCGLLAKELRTRGVGMGVTALVNDTVGTLITEYFEDRRAECGVILGTGFNVAYWERIRNIKKYVRANPNADLSGSMCINMEVGNFDSPRIKVLRYVENEFDQEVDRNSPNVGLGRIEKMISGLYTGELSRMALRYLRDRRVVRGFGGALDKKGGFPSWNISTCLADKTRQLTGIEKLMSTDYKVTTTLLERRAIREVCRCVAERSARLAATVIATVVSKAGYDWDCTVAIDGSVFEKTPGYRGFMKKAFRDFFGAQEYNLRLVLTKDGSGKGAALSAALMS